MTNTFERPSHNEFEHVEQVYEYDIHEKLKFTPDRFGIVDISDIVTALNDNEIQCHCKPYCQMDWHHLAFPAADIERYIWSHSNEDERDLLNFFYRSPFCGVELPRCAHVWLQYNTLPCELPAIEQIRKIHEEYAALSMYTNALSSLLKDYRRHVGHDGSDPDKPTVRQLQPNKQQYALSLLKNKQGGHGQLKDRLRALVGPEAAIVTPEALTLSGSYSALLRDSIQARRITRSQLRAVSTEAAPYNDEYAA